MCQPLVHVAVAEGGASMNYLKLSTQGHKENQKFVSETEPMGRKMRNSAD